MTQSASKIAAYDQQQSDVNMVDEQATTHLPPSFLSHDPEESQAYLKVDQVRQLMQQHVV